MSFFDKVGAKTSFGLGLLGGLAIMFVIGFFILFNLLVTDEDKKTVNANTNVNVNTNQPVAPTQPTQPTAKPPAVQSSDHVRGPENAKITFIEFSDIQCPYCASFHPTAEQIAAEYPNDVRWVYKHFPLSSIHPQAQPAAEASECVAEQKGDEGFFTYLAALYANQASLGRDFYIAEAKKLGVDESQFTDCIDNGKYANKVQTDYQQGLQAGITGTPGSFINDQLVKGALPFAQIKAIIEAELAK